MANYMNKHKRNRNSKAGKPQAHYNTFFDPMVYALDRIKAHFDERAHFSHSRINGERVIRYMLETGGHTVLHSGRNGRLVLNREFKEFTEAQAAVMAKELGMI